MWSLLLANKCVHVRVRTCINDRLCLLDCASHLWCIFFADSAENGSADQTEPDADQFEDAEMDE